MEHPPAPESLDANLIQQGIERALERDGLIDDATVRLIASQVHEGQATAMYALASSGAIIDERLAEELGRDSASELPDDVKGWLHHVSLYAVEHGPRDAVPGWSDITDEQPELPPRRPQIYVACLASYNDGLLFGQWIQADRPVDDIWDDINAMLARSPTPHAEEWAIHDQEDFYGIHIGEYENIDRVSVIARGIAKHGEPFAAWVAYRGTDDLEDLEELFEQAYIGNFASATEMGEELIEEMGIDRTVEAARQLLPESLQHYLDFDVDSYVHDLDCSGDLYMFERSDGSIEAFRNY